jgi:hypothetical protein
MKHLPTNRDPHIPIVFGMAVLLLAAHGLQAQVPERLSYQGRIGVGGTNFTGTGQFKFALVDQGQAVVTRTATATATIGSGPFQAGRITSVVVTDGGTGYSSVPKVRAIDPLRFGSGASLTATVSGGQVTGVTINSGGLNYSAQTYIDIAAPPAQASYVTFWSHDGTSAAGSEPVAAITLSIDQGLFTVFLGDTVLTNMNPLPASVFTNADARLRIWFNDGVQGFKQLSPDQPLGAVGYAMLAAGLPPGTISAQHIAAGAIDGSRLADGAVGNSQLAVGAVTAAKLAGGSVNGSHVAAGSIAATHIATGAIDGSHLANGIVASNHIAAGAVHAVHLAPDVVLGGGATNSATALPAGGIILTGSRTSPGLGYSLVGAMENPFEPAWSAMEALSATVGIGDGASVWTGSELIVWGGWTGSETSDEGARFSPVPGTWTPLSSVGAPAARQYPLSVWTGTEMIVWGGVSGGSSLPATNPGALYHPATDIWRPMTITNAPPTTYGYGPAIWTGSRMLVWGFRNNTNLHALEHLGYIYNPSANTWTTMATNGAPSARQYFTAVWTGSEMIIWGGGTNTAASSAFRNGGRYRLSDNTWRPMNTNVAPEGVRGASAVWTGTRMVVWGGATQTSPNVLRCATGAAYDPTTDTWTPIAQAPIGARSDHSAVYTGSQMLIWGGTKGTDAELNDGAIYSPASDQWLSIPVLGAPTPRWDHIAAWTGNRMIIVNGYPSTSNNRLGGIYDPAKGMFYLHRWQ